VNAASSRYQGCIYFASNALARKMERLANKAWEPVGLSPSHGYLLLLALDQPGIQPSQIAEHLLLAPSTLTRLIEKLEARELVTRHFEGKLTFLHPTEKARTLLPELHACVARFAACFSQESPESQYPSQLTQDIIDAHDRLAG
jgi:DNA-binding MarR family transcriptional regulator